LRNRPDLDKKIDKKEDEETEEILKKMELAEIWKRKQTENLKECNVAKNEKKNLTSFKRDFFLFFLLNKVQGE
jgi:hypothetical protein